jgi:hypothetical protein
MCSGPTLVNNGVNCVGIEIRFVSRFRINRKPFEVALQGLSSFGGKSRAPWSPRWCRADR